MDLVGYTGFVGSNLALSHNFEHIYNSKNISDAYGTSPDVLVYAGVTGTKYIANKFPEKDKAIIDSAIENIKKIKAIKLVLISTIDVYLHPDGEDEDIKPTSPVSFTYGYNRLLLEEWVKKNVDDYCIVRLPGIYGENIRKNYIYDLINPIPQVLTSNKFLELYQREHALGSYYFMGSDGFYHLSVLENDSKSELKGILKRLGFSALDFTDTRGFFQYYNLKYLWNHICIALDNNIKILNIATEPFMVSELFDYLYQQKYINELEASVPYYNYKTKYANLFGGRNGYIFSKGEVMADIKEFIEINK